MGRAAGSDDAEGGDAVTQALVTGAAQRLALGDGRVQEIIG